MAYMKQRYATIFQIFLTYCDLNAVVEEEFRFFTEVKVAIPQGGNALLQVAALHSKAYTSKTTKVLRSLHLK